MLGGFSQGAAVALAAAASDIMQPAALIQLSAQAPPAPLAANALDGTAVLIATGTEDTVAPIATGEALHTACEAAGAKVKPLLRYDGEHEVTPAVAEAIGKFLTELLEPVPID